MDTDIAYLAGIMDGEGSWSIQVQERQKADGTCFPNFNFRMTMTMKYGGKEVTDMLIDNFGGNSYFYEDGMIRWSLGKRKELESSTRQLLPYLHVKRNVAQRFLEALSYMPTTRKAHRRGESSWTPEARAKVTEIATTLNVRS